MKPTPDKFKPEFSVWKTDAKKRKSKKRTPSKWDLRVQTDKEKWAWEHGAEV